MVRQGKGFHGYNEIHSFNAKLPKGSKGQRPVSGAKSNFNAIYQGMPTTVIKNAKNKSLHQTTIERQERNQRLKEIEAGFRKAPKHMEEELARRKAVEFETRLSHKNMLNQLEREESEADKMRYRIKEYKPSFIRKEALLKSKIELAQSQGKKGKAKKYQSQLSKHQSKLAKLNEKAIKADIRAARIAKTIHVAGMPIRAVKRIGKALYIPDALARAEVMTRKLPTEESMREKTITPPIF